MKRIPVAIAKRAAEETNSRQIILLAWDGELTHIVTYGKSADDCAQAAAGGNILKEKWGWPECNDQPSRVKKLQARAEAAESEVSRLRAELAKREVALRKFMALFPISSGSGQCPGVPCFDEFDYEVERNRKGWEIFDRTEWDAAQTAAKLALPDPPKEEV